MKIIVNSLKSDVICSQSICKVKTHSIESFECFNKSIDNNKQFKCFWPKCQYRAKFKCILNETHFNSHK